MKSFIAVFGPVLRWTNKRPIGFVLLLLLLVGGAVGVGAIGMKQMLHKAEGWHATTAVVVKAGQKPVDSYNETETHSLVQYQANGTIHRKILYLDWYKHKGARIRLWVKGRETRQSSPTGIGVVIKRPLLWTVAGLVSGFLFFLLLLLLWEIVEEHDKEAAEQQVKLEDLTRAAPRTRKELYELCLKYADTEAWWVLVENRRYAGIIDTDIGRLRRSCGFTAATVTLGQLAELLNNDDKYARVLKVATCLTAGILQEMGVIRTDYKVMKLKLGRVEHQLHPVAR